MTRQAKRGIVGKKPEEPKERSVLLRKLVAAANRCRERRQELSLLLMEPNVFDIHTDPFGKKAGDQARRALASACDALEPENVALGVARRTATAAIISDCERRGALAVAQHAIAELAKAQIAAEADQDHDLATTLSIGVATVSVVPKNFDPVRMIESAARCLSAARACGISTVKSIEV